MSWEYDYYFILDYVDPLAVTLLKRITSVVMVVLGAVTVHLIVYHSPREMKVYRWYTLALLLASIGFELQWFTLSDVIIFLPSPMFQTNGPLSTWFNIPANYQMTAIILNICLLGTILTSTFFYRFQAFLFDKSYLKMSRKVFYTTIIAINTIPPLFVSTALFTAASSREILPDLLQKHFPSALPLLNQSSGLVVYHEYVSENWFWAGYAYKDFIITCVVLIAFFALASILTLQFNVRRHRVSRATYRKSLQAIGSLIILAAVPLIFLAVPTIIFIYIMMHSYSRNGPENSQELANTVLTLCSLHAPLTCILILTLTKAYRHTLWNTVKLMLASSTNRGCTVVEPPLVLHVGTNVA